MLLRRSLVADDLNLSLNMFIWHDYPAMLENLGLNAKTAGMLLSDLHRNTNWWCHV